MRTVIFIFLAVPDLAATSIGKSLNTFSRDYLLPCVTSLIPSYTASKFARSISIIFSTTSSVCCVTEPSELLTLYYSGVFIFVPPFASVAIYLFMLAAEKCLPTDLWQPLWYRRKSTSSGSALLRGSATS